MLGVKIATNGILRKLFNAIGNLIEFTQSEIKYSKTVDYDLLENFGTDTRALSLELALLGEDEVPPIDWHTDKTKD